MSELLLFALLLPRLAMDRPAAGPSREQVQEWFRANDSAPPASWYPNGDPWRGLTAEELERIEGE